MSKKQNEISKEMKKMNGKFETLNKKVLKMDLNLTQQAESLEFVHAEVKDFKEIIKDTKKGEKILEQCVQDQTTKIAEIRENFNKLERKSRENNLRIVGMKEDENEVPIDLVKGALSNNLVCQKSSWKWPIVPGKFNMSEELYSHGI